MVRPDPTRDSRDTEQDQCGALPALWLVMALVIWAGVWHQEGAGAVCWHGQPGRLWASQVAWLLGDSPCPREVAFVPLGMHFLGTLAEEGHPRLCPDSSSCAVPLVATSRVDMIPVFQSTAWWTVGTGQLWSVGCVPFTLSPRFCTCVLSRFCSLLLEHTMGRGRVGMSMSSSRVSLGGQFLPAEEKPTPHW